MHRKPPTGVLSARIPLDTLARTDALARLRGVQRQEIVILALMLELATAPELTRLDAATTQEPRT
jgi:hypothetical protein